jgi:integrase
MSSRRWKPLVATARAGRIRGAGSEYPAERPLLTVAQVFKLAELVGRRPVGNIRKLPGGGYRLRFQRDGVVRTAQEVCPTRAVTDRTLWEMAADGRADSSHDSRYRALVLLAAFASLRWGEVTALRRCDVGLDASTVRIRAAFAERSTGEIVLGLPKSRADRRIVGIPRAIIPALREHLSGFVTNDPGALVSWSQRRTAALRELRPASVLAARRPGDRCGRPAFHDLQHTANAWAAGSGVGSAT